MYATSGSLPYEKASTNPESKSSIRFMLEEMLDVEESVVCMCDGNGNLYAFGLIFSSTSTGPILRSFNLLYCSV